MFGNEKFEYIVKRTLSSRNNYYEETDEQVELEDQINEEAKIADLEHVQLNQMGAEGWELITTSDDSYVNDDGKKNFVDKHIFKRSSKSKYFGTGFNHGKATSEALQVEDSYKK